MKIDRIAIENLASLRGQQPDIELNGEELEGAGLIAITGATGAGKTTVLDAVCLALYDRTPRLRGRGQDPRELLSRGAAEGRAAVDLTLDDGQRWTAEWNVHRSRLKSDGPLQPSRQRVLDRTTGEILADGKKPVQRLVEQHLGLSFEQFTGVILLAQGEFASFLESSDTERSALLERLTGTEIYSDLGTAAFERHKALRLQLEAEEERYQGLQPLSVAQRAVAEQELDELEPNLVRLEQHLTTVDERLHWVERHTKLTARATSTEESFGNAQHQFDSAERDRERLAHARQAMALRTVLVGADDAERRAQEAREGARRAALESAEQNEGWRRAQAQLRDAEEFLAAALQQGKADLESLRGFAQADNQSLSDFRDLRKDALRATEQEERGRDAASVAFDEAERIRLDAVTAEQKAELAQEACHRVEELMQDLEQRQQRAFGQENHQSLLARQLLLKQAQEIRRALERSDPEPLQEDVTNKEVVVNRLEAEQQAADALLLSAKQDLDRHLGLLSLAERGAELARHRHDLTAGEACPLCGAVDHPFAEQLVPEDELQALRDAETRRQALGEELARAEHDQKAAAELLRRATDELRRAEDKAFDGRRRFAELSSGWLELRLQLADLPVVPLDIDHSELLRRHQQASDRLEAVEAFDLERKQLQDDLEAAMGAKQESDRAQAVTLERVRQIRKRSDDQAAAHHSFQRHRIEAWDRWRTTAIHLARSCELELEALPNGAASEPPILAKELANMATQAQDFEQELLGKRRLYESTLESYRQLEALERRSRPRLQELLAEPEEGPFSEKALAASEPALDPMSADSLSTRLEMLLFEAEQSKQRVSLSADRHQRALETQSETARLLARAKQSLEEHLASSPFANSKQLREAMLAHEALDALAAHLRRLELELERRRIDHKRSLADLEEHASAAHKLGLESEVSSSLKAQLKSAASEVRARLREATNRKMALQLELRSDDERLHERARSEQLLGDLRARRDRSARLSQLIGQKDGGKFRRFAQQLNLEQLLGLANLRLERLAPRYALARLEGGLDLQVIDRAMADEVRPTSTLSGGESFLVSLALALGLADLRRGQLRLGTLFLDEGFGSLDQDTLETALATLEQLQAEQETQILIISHVGPLQERIGHRIEVHKMGGGRSRLRLGLGDGDRAG